LSITRVVWPLLLLALALSQAACSELQSYRDNGFAPVVSRGYGIDFWLAELHGTRDMTPAQIRETVEAWEQELRDDPNDGNRIRLALLLTTGDAPARDPKRARELLDGLEAAPAKASDLELVALLRQILDDQDAAGIAISKLKKQARQQDERIRELEQQQRALTDIEQNIQQRETQPDIEYGNQ